MPDYYFEKLPEKYDPDYDSNIPWYSQRNKIKKNVIEEGVTNIGKLAFYNCSSLTSITIPESVTSIGQQGFEECSSLALITIPESVTSIGSSAFYGNKGLTSITISEGVTSIGSYAFSGCSSLTSITIPRSVEDIQASAFSSCPALTSITVESGNKVYDNRNNCNAIIETLNNGLIVGCKKLLFQIMWSQSVHPHFLVARISLQLLSLIL